MDLEALATKIVTCGAAPKCAVGFSVRTPRGWISRVGGAKDEFFDLASLTKPMTAVAVARAAIEPRTAVVNLLPELHDTASASATMELLLAHRAGLEANLPLFASLMEGGRVDRNEALRRAAKGRRPECRGTIPDDGFAPVYSDLGYIVAGEALARRTRTDDAGGAIAAYVVLPLALADALGTARDLEARGIDLEARAAPTEVVAWRGGEVRGRVHDENAWALTGAGGSGHAGMFGTVGAVLAFGQSVLDELDALAWIVRARPGGTLRAGFDGKSSEASSAGALMGPRAFGHLGFTGTSLWIDPDAQVVLSLLTNRVHPTRHSVAIRAARPWAHDTLMEAALLVSRR